MLFFYLYAFLGEHFNNTRYNRAADSGRNMGTLQGQSLSNLRWVYDLCEYSNVYVILSQRKDAEVGTGRQEDQRGDLWI